MFIWYQELRCARWHREFVELFAFTKLGNQSSWWRLCCPRRILACLNTARSWFTSMHWKDEVVPIPVKSIPLTYCRQFFVKMYWYFHWRQIYHWTDGEILIVCTALHSWTAALLFNTYFRLLSLLMLMMFFCICKQVYISSLSPARCPLLYLSLSYHLIC